MPLRTRQLLPCPLKRPSLSRLSEHEITACLQRAFDALGPEDQANLKTALGPLMEIPNVGLKSALRVAFVVTRGADLDRLDAALTEGGQRKN